MFLVNFNLDTEGFFNIYSCTFVVSSQAFVSLFCLLTSAETAYLIVLRKVMLSPWELSVGLRLRLLRLTTSETSCEYQIVLLGPERGDRDP